MSRRQREAERPGDQYLRDAHRLERKLARRGFLSAQKSSGAAQVVGTAPPWGSEFVPRSSVPSRIDRVTLPTPSFLVNLPRLPENLPHTRSSQELSANPFPGLRIRSPEIPPQKPFVSPFQALHETISKGLAKDANPPEIPPQKPFVSPFQALHETISKGLAKDANPPEIVPPAPPMSVVASRAPQEGEETSLGTLAEGPVCPLLGQRCLENRCQWWTGLDCSLVRQTWAQSEILGRLTVLTDQMAALIQRLWSA